MYFDVFQMFDAELNRPNISLVTGRLVVYSSQVLVVDQKAKHVSTDSGVQPNTNL